MSCWQYAEENENDKMAIRVSLFMPYKNKAPLLSAYPI
jgi:hypothetical protein